MPEPQLSVRSSRPRDLAHRLARRENRTVAEIVVRALQVYEAQEAAREPAAAFYRRLSEQSDSDVDLETIIREERKPYSGMDP